jgi:hypothetical protein
MVQDFPAEWQQNQGNSEYTNNNKLIQNNSNEMDLSRSKRIIVKLNYKIPGVHQRERSIVNQISAASIDTDFQTRSDVLSNSHFKDMPRLVRVSEKSIRGYYEPGFTGIENDLVDRPRRVINVHKKNDIGINRTLVKELSGEKVHASAETQRVSQRNKLHHQEQDADRDNYTPIQIVPVYQDEIVFDVMS